MTSFMDSNEQKNLVPVLRTGSMSNANKRQSQDDAHLQRMGKNPVLKVSSGGARDVARKPIANNLSETSVCSQFSASVVQSSEHGKVCWGKFASLIRLGPTLTLCAAPLLGLSQSKHPKVTPRFQLLIHPVAARAGPYTPSSSLGSALHRYLLFSQNCPRCTFPTLCNVLVSDS